MAAFVNYSKYRNYCEISINCITSKSSKLKYRNFVHFSTTVSCLKFACGDDAGTEKTCAGMGIRPVETGWGGNKVCGDGLGMGTVLWEHEGDQIARISNYLCLLLNPKNLIFRPSK